MSPTDPQRDTVRELFYVKPLLAEMRRDLGLHDLEVVRRHGRKHRHAPHDVRVSFGCGQPDHILGFVDERVYDEVVRTRATVE